MEIRSVSKAIRLLEEFAKEPGVFGVIELARAVDMDKSSVSRMLRTLEQAGMVAQDPASQRYTLGIALAVLGQKALRRLNIRDLARPAIARLVATTGECAHLAILANDRALYVEQAAPPHGIGMDAPIGTLAPLHCTALGKVLLAFQPAERRGSLVAAIPLEAFTRRTITDRDILTAHIEGVRQDGIGFDDEEFSVGVRCIAAPVFNHEGHICGAVGISGPSPRVTDDRMSSWGELIRHEAAELSRQLGYQDEGLGPVSAA
jgi:IclR family acetate operon transcriptional repressor